MTLTVLAMSGGVDSSVAAKLLLDAGHQVVGVFMRHGSESPAVDGRAEANRSRSPAPEHLPIIDPPQRLDHKQGCCSASDAEDARQVAEKLGIPFYALNLQREFSQIIDYFVDEYIRGRTPNPCVMCNHWIKFGKLFAYADAIGADYVATGHYARLLRQDHRAPISQPAPAMTPNPSPAQGNSVRLARGVDRRKDQSYVLFGIRPDLLPRMQLPVGDYDKTTIRGIAAELGLRVAEKRDSQEICFVSSGKHHAFVAGRKQASQDTRGQIVTRSGEVVGEHQGIERFTVGQRKGLGVALGEPQFVQRIDPQTRRVVIGPHHELATYRLVADQANWLVPPAEGTAFRCCVQIRYNSAAVPAQVRRIDERRFEVEFEQPCHGVAPGQAAVCFRDDVVLGGGWIT